MMHEARYYNLTDMLDEQTRMNDCYFEKKDWRACSKEVGILPWERGRVGCRLALVLFDAMQSVSLFLILISV